MLRSVDTNERYAAVSDKHGKFKIEARPGKYWLLVSYSGFSELPVSPTTPGPFRVDAADHFKNAQLKVVKARFILVAIHFADKKA
jgi:hypothetical protein